MRPSEFWGMTPTELWWLFDAKRPVRMYGKMTEHEVARIYRETYGEPED